jgi:chromosome partitioning protein
MKSIVILTQKGGVGKTTLTINLAHFFALSGQKVAVVDLDAQANASFALEEFSSGVKSCSFFNGKISMPPAEKPITLFDADNTLVDLETGKLHLETAAKHFRQKIGLLENAGYDVCMIDVPPAFGLRVYSALLSVGFIVAPIELEAFSIQGIKTLMAVVNNVMKANTELRFLGMLANKVDARNQRHIDNLAQLRETYGDYLLPVTVGLRGSIAESLITGETLFENNKTAARPARREIKALGEHLLKIMAEEAVV